MIQPHILLLLLLLRLEFAHAIVGYYDEGAPIQDSCDRTKWRVCSTDDDCATYGIWSSLTFAGPGTSVPSWESDMSYRNYAAYRCLSPLAEHGMEDCEATRCLPVPASGYACNVDGDCPDGQVCDGGGGNDVDATPAGLCTACARGGTSDPVHFSDGACHQPRTPGNSDGTPQFDEGESGCAGDHCRHMCAYDTKCVRVTDGTAELDLTAPHNQLPGRLVLTDEDRNTLMRPSTCGGNDEGTAVRLVFKPLI